MENNKQPKTCEEYVLQEFSKAKEEAETLKIKNEQLNFDNKTLEEKLLGLIDLMRKIAKEVEIEEYDGDYPRKTIRLNDYFIASLYDDSTDKTMTEDQRLAKALVELHELVSSIPVREE